METKLRLIDSKEIDKVADLLATAYYDDIFFKWCVPNDNERQKVVSDYYKIYIGSRGCISHVAESIRGIVGATVWLPHDTEEGIYKDIEKIAGKNAPQFTSVAEKSHKNEPKNSFYQLVGFGVSKDNQGKGIGQELIKYHLNILDPLGIPTYLEASTPFHGDGIYGKFGYEPYGELMYFTNTAVLYPLYREAKKEERL